MKPISYLLLPFVIFVSLSCSDDDNKNPIAPSTTNQLSSSEICLVGGIGDMSIQMSNYLRREQGLDYMLLYYSFDNHFSCEGDTICSLRALGDVNLDLYNDLVWETSYSPKYHFWETKNCEDSMSCYWQANIELAMEIRNIHASQVSWDFDNYYQCDQDDQCKLRAIGDMIQSTWYDIAPASQYNDGRITNWSIGCLQ